MPSVILFLHEACPNQTKNNLLKSLAVLETNIPVLRAPRGCRGEPWSLWSPGESIGRPPSELGVPRPPHPTRAKLITLSQTKVSLEFLP